MPNPPLLPRPVIFSQGHVTQALADQRFFELLPEFRPIGAKVQAAKAELQQRRGCSGCRKHRIVGNILGDFIQTMTSLSPQGLARLKQYFGAPTLMVNQIDPATGQAQLRVL